MTSIQAAIRDIRKDTAPLTRRMDELSAADMVRTLLEDSQKGKVPPMKRAVLLGKLTPEQKRVKLMDEDEVE